MWRNQPLSCGWLASCVGEVTVTQSHRICKMPVLGQPGSSWSLGLVLRHLFKAWAFFHKRERERADTISWSRWQVLGLCSVRGGGFLQTRRTGPRHGSLSGPDGYLDSS